MNIKRIREQRGLTQQALAKKVKIHRVSVARIESQAMGPSLATLDRIAKALGVPVTELLE